jgi:hypothetical protein
MRYDQIAGLDVQVDDCEFELREQDVSSGFTRTTTVVSLSGDGHTGRGEDVTYDSEPHYSLVEDNPEPPIIGSRSFTEVSEQLAETDLLFRDEPAQSVFRNYRRWAFESAALDLALKQAGTDLATQLDQSYSPVRFVVSTRLGDPPTATRVTDWLDHDPTLEFKLDPTSDWTPDIVKRLAETGAVRILDLKGKYEGTDVDQSGDRDLYELVLEQFPDAVVEDPDLTDETRPLFEGNEGRVSWDYPIQGVENVRALPWEPNWLNIKPSRFGSVESLLGTIEYCKERSIQLYGGGQFELDIGRQHLHALASLFYPNGPNDIAPMGYNDPEPSVGLPGSPMSPPATPDGFEWN